MLAHKNNLIWIDLEMTGLDSQTHEIIEIATIITDAELNILAEGPVLAIHQPDQIIDNLDEWNTHYHGKSGLVDRVKASAISYAEAEQATLEFVRQYVPKRQSPMCGNSICQDRRFMARLMPDLEAFFHYRNLDVSTLKELAKRWYPDAMYQKQSTHTALADIKDSIDELRHYRQQLFIKKHEPD
ncbi:oligoribonuclease [Suttonella sp. R2A3]|uniref:oligoribonuclease n=1 Tax=Suttonella sp. R2A3 TaxID=2908648 RepID=UPI001F27CC2B|nr:oligoribonuclease [Suttonella sp. R2A3]UJF25394.1 oligoribonuclease [Suttonella sp. R2A3]